MSVWGRRGARAHRQSQKSLLPLNQGFPGRAGAHEWGARAETVGMPVVFPDPNGGIPTAYGTPGKLASSWIQEEVILVSLGLGVCQKSSCHPEGRQAAPSTE